MDLSQSRILITGGAGFIGTALTKRLIDDNLILIYDSFGRDALKNTNLSSHPNIKIVKGDVLDSSHLETVFSDFKPEIVIHMAAVAGIDTVIKSPINTMKINIVGTANVLEATKPFVGIIKRFVDFSTSEVFGTNAFKLEEESSVNLRPVGEARWVYAVSKLASEHLTYSYYRELNLPIVIVRPFNVYGPGQVGEGAIHVFVKRAINNEEIQINGDGDQIRSWCFIDDMVAGILLCLEKKEAVGEVFNIGNPRSTITILELAKKIVNLSGSKSKIVHVPRNYIDVELRIANIEKAKAILNYSPNFDLDEGLLKTIEWYKKLKDD